MISLGPTWGERTKSGEHNLIGTVVHPMIYSVSVTVLPSSVSNPILKEIIQPSESHSTQMGHEHPWNTCVSKNILSVRTRFQDGGFGWFWNVCLLSSFFVYKLG